MLFRSCEDIDEATLSYAEIKAVATGNPLIKEKMEIDNDVQRLKLLKASYDNQRYGLQDNFMIKYPKLIKTATEKLANVREDVKARDKELIDNPEFAITIGKATYTERVDGGTMMLEAISKCKTGETTAIGKFHGFELLVEKNFLGINYMVLRGKTEYKAELSTSPVGSMVKLENLFNGLHENIDFLEKKIEQYQNDLEASKAEYDKPFAYSEELNEKLARQCELNAQLDLENAKAVDADLSGPEEERETDDRMESAAIVAEDKGAYPADRERGIQAKGFNERIFGIGHFYKFMEVKQYITRMPFRIEYFQQKEVIVHHDRSVEETVYMEILKKLYLFPERLRCMFLHLWCLGLRASEVCTLKGNAYYQQGEDYWIQVYQVKMKNYKRIPIPQALYQIMKVYLKKHEIQPEEFIFINSRGGACLYGTFRTQMIEACRENKIANGEYLFQSHDYRHTVATMFYDSHVSLQSIRDYLGHTYEEMTRQYIDYMPQRIAKANDEFFEMQGSSLASWLKKEEKDGK